MSYTPNIPYCLLEKVEAIKEGKIPNSVKVFSESKIKGIAGSRYLPQWVKLVRLFLFWIECFSYFCTARGSFIL